MTNFTSWTNRSPTHSMFCQPKDQPSFVCMGRVTPATVLSGKAPILAPPDFSVARSYCFISDFTLFLYGVNILDIKRREVAGKVWECEAQPVMVERNNVHSVKSQHGCVTDTTADFIFPLFLEIAQPFWRAIYLFWASWELQAGLYFSEENQVLHKGRTQPK